MLVLERRFRDAITITDRRTRETIIITMVKCNGPVRIGIDANDNYYIVRNELLAEPVSADKKLSRENGVAEG